MLQNCSLKHKQCVQLLAVKITENKMSYSESELHSNFAINSSESGSESEPNSSSAFMNLDICIFLFYTCTLLNKIADNFFYSFS